MRQAKRALAFAALLMSGLAGACGDLPVAPTQAEAGGAARLFSAPSVTISGPSYVTAKPGTHTWYANASGGNGSYTYQWEINEFGSSTWIGPIGTGNSHTRMFDYHSGSFTLRVTVTSAGVSASTTHFVWVENCCS